MKEEPELLYQILLSVDSKNYLHNYDLNLSPDEFYKLIIKLVDKGLLFNIPDPICNKEQIIYYDINNSQLTGKGKEFIKNYIAKEAKSTMLNEVFIVHGHDDALKNEVARTIEKAGLKVTILHEKPNKGFTSIIQKFEEYAKKIGYAVVLMTPDDRGKEKNEKRYKERARQNVIFELGYFVGRIGPNSVSAIHTENIELPSDINGVLYIEYDKAGGWKMELLKDLESAGFNINWSNI